jgi:hypothetical protein
VLFEAVRSHTIALAARLFPERPARGAPVFSKFALPRQCNPALGFVEGAVAAAAVFARILALCVIFAVWGVMSLVGWSRIASPFWRGVVLLPLVLALPAALLPVMLVIAAIERWILARRP